MTWRYFGDPVAESVLDESKNEIEIFRRFSSGSGYTFVVAKKDKRKIIFEDRGLTD